MKKFFSLVLALAMALSMASFASAEETTTIHIGVIGPMTGAAAVYGLAVARGAEIAVEEINAAGKVNIVLDVQDDENDAEKSINAYNATLDKGTQVILGCVTTTPCIAVSAQAYDERVFMLTPSPPRWKSSRTRTMRIRSASRTRHRAPRPLNTSSTRRSARRSPSSTTTPTPIPPVSIRPLRARLPSWG